MYVIVGKSYYPSSRIIIYIRFELTNKSPLPLSLFVRARDSREITLSEIYFPIRFADLFFFFFFIIPRVWAVINCPEIARLADGWVEGTEEKCSTTRVHSTPSQSVIYKELFSLKSFRFF